MEGKREMRRRLRALRAAVPPAVRTSSSSSICRNILSRDEVRRARAARRTFAVYLALPDEIDLSVLIAALASAGVPLAAPRWNGSAYALARLTALADGRWALRDGPHGIPEPMEDISAAAAEIGVWIVPGLAFTADGRRLGYGGGWYDRFLAAASPDACALGVAYPFQMVDDLPAEPHDRPLSAVVLP